MQPFLVVLVGHAVCASLIAWRDRAELRNRRRGWCRQQLLLLLLPLTCVTLTVLSYTWVPYEEHYYSIVSAPDFQVYWRL